MSIHKQAHAEAERIFPKRSEHTAWIDSQRRIAYERGYRSGHEAATRARVVTTVTELEALPDRTCIIDADMELHQRHGSLLDRTVESAWLGLLPPTLSASSEIRLPARVLYEPEEGR